MTTTPTGRLPCQTSVCSEIFVALINWYILNLYVLLDQEHESGESKLLTNTALLTAPSVPYKSHLCESKALTCRAEVGDLPREDGIQEEVSNCHVL